MRLLCVLAISVGALVFSPLKLMANTDLPVDPRLESYFEGYTEEHRELLWSMFADKPDRELEVWIRLTLWHDFLEQEGLSAELHQVFSAMADTVDGCLLPRSYCDEMRASTLKKYQSYPVSVPMQILGSAMAQMSVFQPADCETGRLGVQTGYSMKIGNDYMTLMTASSEDSAPCFVRKLGAS